ncbi:hypothetical protein BU16DRAFT_533590 [Lophium mytilinum]|uniref:Uncharacterized protein n=1 Tax=Lophium mytilinum TaxID=390894 RepID=A0A6A6REU4_9PEZI|nr:hypothetical protein BU16DRAFT_533590 [Lophium mytilinum]
MSQTPDVRMTVEAPGRDSPSPENQGYLYVTPFHFECGPEKKRLMVHKELMCSTSPYIRGLCEKAKPLRGSSETLAELSDFFEELLKEGNAAGVNTSRVKALIKVWRGQHSVSANTKKDLKELIKVQTNSVYMNTKMRDTKNAPEGVDSNPGIDSIPDRLWLLKAVAVRKVAEALRDALKTIKREESESIARNPLQAMAHDTLVLEDISSQTVQHLIQWLYQGALQDRISVARMCELYTLAHRFRMDTLQEIVMTRIIACIVHEVEISAPELKIEPSTSQTSEQHPTPTPQMSPLYPPLASVLEYVFATPKAPEKLRNLVTETLAWCAKPSDLVAIQNQLSRKMALLLAHAVLERLTDVRTAGVELSLMERLKRADEKTAQEAVN